jgi:PleD family two-component response regulator
LEYGLNTADKQQGGSQDFSLEGTWNRFSKLSEQKVQLIELATWQHCQGNLTAEILAEAVTAARYIRDSLQAFGLVEGTSLSGQVEALLERPLSEIETGKIAQLLIWLRMELQKGPSALFGRKRSSGENSVSIWMLTLNDELSDRLQIASSSRGYKAYRAPSFAEAMRQDDFASADLVLLDLHDCSNLIESEFGAELKELNRAYPSLPVMVLVSNDSFDFRVQIARYRTVACLSHSLPTDRLLDSMTRALALKNQGRGRILVVDDDIVIRKVVRRVLEQAGYRVVVLESGKEVWKSLVEVNPDLLIFDFMMPEVSGTDICRVVRNEPRWASLPILFLTGSRDSDTVKQVFASGADDFVTKPVVGPELIARIDNRLRRAREIRIQGDQDSLTGMQGRYRAGEVMALLLRLGQRQDLPLAVAMLCVHNTDQIAFGRGLAVCDESLLELIDACQKFLRRPGDQISRWSESTVVVAMFDTTREYARERIELIYRAFAASTIAKNEKLQLCSSVAAFPADGPDFNSLIQRLEVLLDNCLPGKINEVSSNLDRDEMDIVLVDYNQEQAEMLRNYLRGKGYPVRWLPDIQSVSRLLVGPTAELSPKVVLLDLDLPFVDGYEYLKKLRGELRSPKTRIVTISENSDPSNVLRAQELGAFDYITKPFPLSIIGQRVERALGS